MSARNGLSARNRLSARSRLDARGRRGAVALLLVPVVVAASALLASCSGADAGGEEPPALGALPQIRSEADLVLPLDHYLPSPRDRAVLATARSEVTAQCMAKLGFAGYPVDSYLAQTKVPLHGNTFGVLDESVAKAGAYKAHFEQPLLAQADDIARQSEKWDRPEVSAALHGVDEDPNRVVAQRSERTGPSVPGGGCAGSAPRELYASVGVPPPQPVNWIDDLQGDAFALAASDSRLVPVTAAWSACMRGQGYDYASPSDSNNDQRWADAGPAARRAAVTDVRCKWSSGYIDTFVALDAAYERRAIEANAERLQRALDQRRRLLAEVASRGLGRIRDVGDA